MPAATALSMAFCDKADQINWSAFLNSGTVFGFSFSSWWDSSIAPKPDNPVDWSWVNWGPLIISDEVEAIWLGETQTWNAKTISTPRKINATLLNIKINWPKLVSMCGYILATNWQNFMAMLAIYFVWMKILQIVLGGLLFWLTLYIHSW